MEALGAPGAGPVVALENLFPPIPSEVILDKVEAWFLRHGYKAEFLGRLLPLFRSLVSIPAGIERMPALGELRMARSKVDA